MPPIPFEPSGSTAQPPPDDVPPESPLPLLEPLLAPLLDPLVPDDELLVP